MTDDAPTINPRIAAAIEAIRTVYRFNELGGNLHVAIDDGNTDALDFCEMSIRENIWEASEAQLAAERACLEALRRLPDDERNRAVATYHGWALDDDDPAEPDPAVWV